jgi:dTDP-4-amino-4,6-dideoxygalactose transaminase
VKVPLQDLKAHHAPLRAEIVRAMERVLDSNAFILGPDVKALEEEVARYSHTAYGIGVSSGTDALLVALMALNVGSGDEVITTPFSFFATAGVVVRLGARPVFVDIDPTTYNLDPRKLEQAITPRTKAIVPVHLYGQCADMDPILALAEAHNLKVIEDAAQAIGAEYRGGRRAGSMGQLGCFSFFPGKNLGGVGDGGMVVTNDADLAEKVRILRVHGGKPKYYHKMIGGNFRLDTLQAAVLRVKLPHLDAWTQRRQENARRYVELFHASGLVEQGLVRLPQAVWEGPGVAHAHIYNQFVIRVPNRDELRMYLADEGISTEIYYPVPFHLQECFRPLGYKEGAFPEAERAARETVALPIYPELLDEQLRRVVDAMRTYHQRGTTVTISRTARVTETVR